MIYLNCITGEETLKNGKKSLKTGVLRCFVTGFREDNPNSVYHVDIQNEESELQGYS